MIPLTAQRTCYFSLLIVPFCVLVSIATVATPEASAQSLVNDDDQSAPEQTVKREGTAVRGGLLLNGLADSPDTMPIFYFDLGVQRKAGEYYFDLRAPFLFFFVDGMITLVRIMGGQDADLFFMMMNGDDVPNHWELIHGRLGYRFRIIPPGDFEVWQNSYEAAVGFFSSAEFVLFDSRRDITSPQANAAGYSEPLILALGGFFTIGRTLSTVQFDLSFGAGTNVGDVDFLATGPIYLFTSDIDVQYELAIRGSFYIRPRVTVYVTDLDPALHLTAGLTAGLSLRF